MYYKAIMLFVGVLTYSYSVAQSYRLDSVVKTINETKNVVFFKYDNVDLIIENISYDLKGPAVEVQEKTSNRCHFDERGNLLNSLYTRWNLLTNDWDNVSKYTSNYNENNQLIQHTSYYGEDKNWTKEFEVTYSHGADTLTEIYYELKDGILQAIQKSIKKNNSLFADDWENILFLWNQSNHSWENYIHTTNIFSRDSIVLGYERYGWKDNEWSNEQRVIYEFDEKGNKTESYTVYTGIGTAWVPAYKFEDKNLIINDQRVSQSRTYRWTEGVDAWKISSEVKQCQDENGMDLESFCYLLNTKNNQLMLVAQSMWEYDDNKRVKLTKTLNYQDDLLDDGFQFTYTYNDEGKLLVKNEYVLDKDNTTWKMLRSTEFSYARAITIIEMDETVYDYMDVTIAFDVKHPFDRIRIYEFVDDKKILVEEQVYFYSQILI